MIDEQHKPKRRPKITDAEWQALHDEWFIGTQTKKDFLEGKGLCSTAGNVRAKIKHWKRDLDDDLRGVRRNKDLLKAAQEQNGLSEGLSLNSPADVLKLINKWKLSQSHNDYRTAESLRTHIKIILNDAFVVAKDKNGDLILDANGKKRYVTTLKPQAIRSLTASLESLQKIQRLALGMSTENVGIEGQIVGGEVFKKDECPIFEVQINKNGKFETARPAKVRR